MESRVFLLQLKLVFPGECIDEQLSCSQTSLDVCVFRRCHRSNLRAESDFIKIKKLSFEYCSRRVQRNVQVEHKRVLKTPREKEISEWKRTEDDTQKNSPSSNSYFWERENERNKIFALLHCFLLNYKSKELKMTSSAHTLARYEKVFKAFHRIPPSENRSIVVRNG